MGYTVVQVSDWQKQRLGFIFRKWCTSLLYEVSATVKALITVTRANWAMGESGNRQYIWWAIQ
jgi:hypothetical protein